MSQNLLVSKISNGFSISSSLVINRRLSRHKDLDGWEPLNTIILLHCSSKVKKLEALDDNYISQDSIPQT